MFPWRRFVIPLSPAIAVLTAFRQNLRDEVAMDVDEEEEEGDSAQRLRRVPDYGIEVDFEFLSANEREVSDLCLSATCCAPFLCDRPGVDAERRWRSTGRF